MNIIWNNEDYLMHYGIPRRSGRYKWGSGEDPYHHGESAPNKKRRRKLEKIEEQRNRIYNPSSRIDPTTRIGKRMAEPNIRIPIVGKVVKGITSNTQKTGNVIARGLKAARPIHGYRDRQIHKWERRMDKNLGNIEKPEKALKSAKKLTLHRARKDRKLFRQQQKIRAKIEGVSYKTINRRDINEGRAILERWLNY